MNYNKNSREIGFRKEREVVAFLEGKGLKVLETNYSCRFGEIDIIAKDEAYLVFFEVKYRKSQDIMLPVAAVDHTKQNRICRAGDCYRIKNGYSDDCAFRYDVIAISDCSIRWYKNAFEHIFVNRKSSARRRW